MGEWADQWATQGVTNLWSTVPRVTEMHSESGAESRVPSLHFFNGFCASREVAKVPNGAQRLLDLAQDDIGVRWRHYDLVAAMPPAAGGTHD